MSASAAEGSAATPAIGADAKRSSIVAGPPLRGENWRRLARRRRRGRDERRLRVPSLVPGKCGVLLRGGRQFGEGFSRVEATGAGACAGSTQPTLAHPRNPHGSASAAGPVATAGCRRVLLRLLRLLLPLPLLPLRGEIESLRRAGVTGVSRAALSLLQDLPPRIVLVVVTLALALAAAAAADSPVRLLAPRPPVARLSRSR